MAETRASRPDGITSTWPVGPSLNRRPRINHQAYVSAQQLNYKQIVPLAVTSQNVGRVAAFGGQVPVALRWGSIEGGMIGWGWRQQAVTREGMRQA